MRTLLGVIFLFLIGASAIYLSAVWGERCRVDLTANDIYSLSEGTRGILRKLPAPLTMRFYYSKSSAMRGGSQFRQWNNFADYVEGLLREYRHHAGGKITLEVIDPVTDSPEERDAELYGLKKFDLGDDSYFFGLAILDETGRHKTIEFFSLDQQSFLEYSITKLIHGMGKTSRPVIGIVSSLPVMGDQGLSDYMKQMMRMQGRPVQDPWLFLSRLEDFYEFKEISAASDMAGADALLVIHPKKLAEDLRYGIDQYVVNGGKAAVLVDPHCLTEQPAPNPQNPMAAQYASRESELNSLLEPWGIGTMLNRFTMDLQFCRYGDSSHLAVLHIDERGVRPEDPIAGKLTNLLFILPGVITVKLNPETVRDAAGEPILTTTDKGNHVFVSTFEMQNNDELMKKFAEGKEKVVVGYRLNGKFLSTFKDNPGNNKPADNDGSGKPDGENGGTPGEGADAQPETLPHAAGGEKDGTVVVIADVDWLTNDYCYPPNFLGMHSKSNENEDLLMSLLESLLGSTEMNSIRGRGDVERRLTKVDDIEQAAEREIHDSKLHVQAAIDEANEKLRTMQEEGKDAAALSNELMKEQKAIAKQIAGLEDELRELNRKKRQRIDTLGFKLNLMNMLLVPALIIAYSAYLAWWRRQKHAQFVRQQDAG